MLCTTFDHKVSRDPLRYATRCSEGNELKAADAAITHSQGSAADMATALELDLWALDKPTSIALREWAQNRLETHVWVDCFSDPSKWARRSATFTLGRKRLSSPLASVARFSQVCARSPQDLGGPGLRFH